MKTIIFFLFSLLVVEAVCAEQRISAIRAGDPCDRIAEVEKRLGSLELAVRVTDSFGEYKGTQGGKTATIVYRCDEGRLTEQKIVVSAKTRDEAYSFANMQKSKLIKQLGEPLHDGLALGIWDRLLLGFKGADLDYLSTIVVWGRTEKDVMLSVREVAENLWEVSISQGSSKIGYILNS